MECSEDWATVKGNGINLSPRHRGNIKFRTKPSPRHRGHIKFRIKPSPRHRVYIKFREKPSPRHHGHVKWYTSQIQICAWLTYKSERGDRLTGVCKRLCLKIIFFWGFNVEWQFFFECKFIWKLWWRDDDFLTCLSFIELTYRHRAATYFSYHWMGFPNPVSFQSQHY